jgi:hypothetical protein
MVPTAALLQSAVQCSVTECQCTHTLRSARARLSGACRRQLLHLLTAACVVCTPDFLCLALSVPLDSTLPGRGQTRAARLRRLPVVPSYPVPYQVGCHCDPAHSPSRTPVQWMRAVGMPLAAAVAATSCPPVDDQTCRHVSALLLARPKIRLPAQDAPARHGATDRYGPRRCAVTAVWRSQNRYRYRYDYDCACSGRPQLHTIMVMHVCV